MRALVFSAPQQASIADVDDPKAGPGEVVVRSRMVGVCHSDLELLHGRYIIPIRYPVTPGHEWAGEVAEVGPGVEGFAPGDPVVGECVVGPGGRDHFGFSISGAAAEYFGARAEWLHKIPAQLSYTQGALIEPFSVAYAAVRTGAVDPATASPSWAAARSACCRRWPRWAAMRTSCSSSPGPTAAPRALNSACSRPSTRRQARCATRPWRSPAGSCSTWSSSRPGTRPTMAQALTIAGNRARIVYVGIDVGGKVEAELASSRPGRCVSRASSTRPASRRRRSGSWPAASSTPRRSSPPGTRSPRRWTRSAPHRSGRATSRFTSSTSA